MDNTVTTEIWHLLASISALLAALALYLRAYITRPTPASPRIVAAEDENWPVMEIPPHFPERLTNIVEETRLSDPAGEDAVRIWAIGRAADIALRPDIAYNGFGYGGPREIRPLVLWKLDTAVKIGQMSASEVERAADLTVKYHAYLVGGVR